MLTTDMSMTQIDMPVRVLLDNVSGSEAGVPPARDIRRWVKLALAGERVDAEIGVRIVDEAEGAELNKQWRQKNKPTNVLSFPLDVVGDKGVLLLGDIVICAPVVAQEAQAQGKLALSHWAHLVIHGTLHLLGYDHETEAEADLMEARETALLAKLGVANPYT
jgi:probable rRNA maturation factor